LLTAIALAAFLRLYRLGEWPPGLYRDEAYNGLDALGVLRGEHHLFFQANNGREPVYIYLAALAVALLGPTAIALRLPAALAGALATLPAFLLGREWFGRVAGLLTAFLWAFTFWSVHLGRIGLRVGLLAPLLALSFWLGTRAYRQRRAGLWLAAGLIYGLSFYTYLAARFTPLLLALFAAYLVLTGRRERLWDGGRALWFVFGAALALAPLGAVMLADPSILLGRAGQVSILSPEVHGGDPLGVLLGNTGRALGMYLWRGDPILRHNALLGEGVLWHNFWPNGEPVGRPVFDWLMAAPFLAGLVWCLRRWREPAPTFLILWQLVMLGPTILAEDTPHFLRAAGVLPGAVFFPAIGLSLLWEWERLPPALRRAAVVLLLAGSLALTARDYADYGRQPDVAYLWEAAAAELARSAAASAGDATVYLDERFIEGWPSVPFLLTGHPVTLFRPESGSLDLPDGPAVLYFWPYGLQEFLTGVAPPAAVDVAAGPLARGDLEPEPYSLYTRLAIRPGATPDGTIANFDNRHALRGATYDPLGSEVEVALQWEAQPGAETPATLPNLFIHVVGPEGIIGQHDGPLGDGLWPASLWQPGLVIGERHTIPLSRPFDPAQDQVQLGLYRLETGERLPVVDEGSAVIDDHVILSPDSAR
jgi:4-amino-4-deoxy-L-arabinose transferase-like glycosyltransferase